MDKKKIKNTLLYAASAVLLIVSGLQYWRGGDGSVLLAVSFMLFALAAGIVKRTKK